MMLLVLGVVALVYVLAHDHTRQMQLEENMAELYSIEYRRPYPTSD